MLLLSRNEWGFHACEAPMFYAIEMQRVSISIVNILMPVGIRHISGTLQEPGVALLSSRNGQEFHACETPVYHAHRHNAV